MSGLHRERGAAVSLCLGCGRGAHNEITVGVNHHVDYVGDDDFERWTTPAVDLGCVCDQCLRSVDIKAQEIVDAIAAVIRS